MVPLLFCDWGHRRAGKSRILSHHHSAQSPAYKQRGGGSTMKKVSVIFILTMAIAAFANAQATRTWVSGVGDDVNPCSRTAPCKTFAGAISKTADKGEIDALDSAGFGTVTITKSITIDGGGTLAGVLYAGTNGIQ